MLGVKSQRARGYPAIPFQPGLRERPSSFWPRFAEAVSLGQRENGRRACTALLRTIRPSSVAQWGPARPISL